MVTTSTASTISLSGVATRRVPRTCTRTGTGKNTPPCTGMGMETEQNYRYGDGDGLAKPDGGSPVAIPNLAGH
uniref:Uncharacterized protein n=1 Tax=Oryza punctata TaxID=4537 RepID=A0A0E0K674_ORYPU